MGITIKEIAKLSGFSRGTVDRALKNSPNIKEQTKEIVMKIVKYNNYTPNIIGQALAFSRKEYKVAVLINSVGNDFFIEIINGLNKGIAECKSFGMSLELIELRGFNIEGQLEFLNAFDLSKYQALIITAVDDPYVQHRLAMLSAMGVCIITMNSDVDFDKKICYVGCDYLQSGRTAGGLVKVVSDGNCGLLIVTGSTNVLGHRQRVDGILQSIESCENVKYFGTILTNDDEEESYCKVKECLQKNKEISVVCAAAGGVVGTQRAVSELGRKIKIIAFDNTEKINDLLKADKIVATINQQPFEQGYKSVKALYDFAFCHTTQPKMIKTQLSIKIKENL